MRIGRAMLGRDVGKERKKLSAEKKRLEDEATKQAKKQQKAGMWGSIGKTLGSIGAGALGTMLGGPAGGVLAAKMVGGYLGGRAGQALGGKGATSEDLEYQGGKGTYLSEDRKGLKEGAETLREDWETADKNMEKQLLMSSIASPLMGAGLDKLGELGTAKEMVPGMDYAAGITPETFGAALEADPSLAYQVSQPLGKFGSSAVDLLSQSDELRALFGEEPLDTGFRKGGYVNRAYR